MKRLICLLICLLLLSPASLCIAAQEDDLIAVSIATDDYPALIGAPAIPMYEAPTDGSRRIGGLFPGTKLKVLDQGSGWTQVWVGSVTGWIPASCAVASTADADASVRETARVFTIGSEEGCILRREPDAHSEEVSRIHAESTVTPTVLLAGGEWMQVISPEGNVGWVENAQLSITGSHEWACVQNDAPTNRLHLRAAPSTKADSLGKYYTGVMVRLQYDEARLEGWQRVAIEGVSGWVKSDYLVWGSDNRTGYLPPLGHVVGAEGNGLNLRVQPSFTADVRAQYPNGTAVELLGVIGQWAHVRLRDGHSGYMAFKHLNGETESALSGETVTLAEITAGDTVYPIGTTAYLSQRPRKQWRWADGDAPSLQYIEEDTTVLIIGEGNAKNSVSAPMGAVTLDW